MWHHMASSGQCPVNKSDPCRSEGLRVAMSFLCSLPRMRQSWMSCVGITINKMVKVKMKSWKLSRVPLFATPWTVAYQAPPSMGFSRQECWSGLPFPSSRGSSRPRNRTRVSRIAGRCLRSQPPGGYHHITALVDSGTMPSADFCWMQSVSNRLSLSCYNKYHGLGDLNHKHLFLIVPEAGMFKIKMPADSASGKNLFLVYGWSSSCSILT